MAPSKCISSKTQRKMEESETVKQLLIDNTNIKENESFETIPSIESTPNVQALWGINNFIAKVEANSMELLNGIIKTDLKLAMEVSSLLTLIIADSPRKQ